jgi:murein DD-endopeptidase MepM/ murein hydrolase activator NlpD
MRKTLRSAFAAAVAIAVLAPSAASGGVRQEPQASAEQERPTLDVEIVARALQPGEVVRVDISCSCSGQRPSASAFGSEVALFPRSGGRSWSGLIGIDVDAMPGVSDLDVRLEPPGHRPIVVTRPLNVVAKQFPTRRLRVAPTYVDPPPDELARIVRDAELLRTVFAKVTPRIWDGPFVRPVEAPANSNFGSRSIFNGQPRSPHGGVDFASPAGTPVAAAGGGRVAIAEDLFFTGQTVVIDHGLGLYSVFAHLSTLNVAEGDRVERGDIVGRVGATGRVTGAHLHWGVRLNGARVDPMSLLAATGSL